jgi:hypothetical protein
MRVSLTTHIDRSDKALLRGCSGTLLGWVLDPREPHVNTQEDHRLTYQPLVVYIKFDDAEWDALEGLSQTERGIYPIIPRNEYWYLDGKRKGGKCMRIRRRQLPIHPNPNANTNLDNCLPEVCTSPNPALALTLPI